MIGRTFEAIALRWEGVTAPDPPADASGLRARLEALSAAGVHVVLVSDGRPEETDRRLEASPEGPGTLHLCAARGTTLLEVTSHGTRPRYDPTPPVADARGGTGPPATPRPTGGPPEGTAGALERVAAFLGDRGIAGELTLIVNGASGSGASTDHPGEPPLVDAFPRAVVVSVGATPDVLTHGVVHPVGGSDQVISLLDEQLTRRTEHRVPQIDGDPAWTLRLPEDRGRERVTEALAALGNGSAGTRGSWEEAGAAATPLFVVDGVYTADSHRLPGPVWTGFDRTDPAPAGRGARLLDLRGGTLYRCGDGDRTLRSLRFVSLATPQVMALRAEGPETLLHPGDPLRPPSGDAGFESGRRGDRCGATTGDEAAGIAVAARDRVVTSDGRRTVERLAAWTAGRSGPAGLGDANRRLAEAEARGFDTSLADHRQAWAGRWADAEVTIDGDPDAELAARFAVFHLLSAASEHGEAAVGARGLTGTGYAGHVFWDADVFVLPALAALCPPAARAMIEYRLRRLPAARAAALALGRDGARFPWESAGDGTDVTPRRARGADGSSVAIETGPHEEHIVADVAWAAAHYASWTGDAAFLVGAGRPLLVDTARYWASRIETDDDGSGHIRGVIGPDEYHEGVDDNAYTNIMARWNLRRGATLLAALGDSDGASVWRDLAGSLVDGWDPRVRLYQQFHGYFDLEPLLMSEVGAPPIAVDMLLGAARVSSSQLIKQADVLMAHHLVPDQLEPGSLRPCLDFYEPRTAHGSSLSPAISASLLARAGEPERALALFRLAARLDLDDTTGTTADGLHLATMGGVWQALAFGFLGLAAQGGTLAVRPHLPSAWTSLALRLHFGGQPIGVRAGTDHVTVTCVAPLPVDVDGRGRTWCGPGTTSIALTGPRGPGESR